MKLTPLQRTYLFSFSTAVFAGLLVMNRYLEWGGPGGLFKQAASTSFLLVAWSAGALRHRYGRWIFAGLVASWWGDLFLVFQGDIYFLCGLISFLVGHILYSIAFVSYGISWRVTAGVTPFILLLVAFIAPDIWSHAPAGLKPAVGAYIVVISTMAILAAGAGARGNWLFLVGALMFYVSDIAVAREAFDVSEAPDYVWGLPLYYGGQVVLAWAAGKAKNTQFR